MSLLDVQGHVPNDDRQLQLEPYQRPQLQLLLYSAPQILALPEKVDATKKHHGAILDGLDWMENSLR